MTRIAVPTMHCGHCKAKIENALLEADVGAELSFDMEAREVEVDSTLDVSEIIATVKGAGYEASQIG